MKLAGHTPKKEAFSKLLAGLLLAVAALAAHASAVSASALLGVVVTNPQGERLGTIQDLAMEREIRIDRVRNRGLPRP